MRQRTSIVNRGELERNNLTSAAQEQIAQYYKNCVLPLIVIVWLVVSVYLPGWAGGERSEECEWEMWKTNLAFVAFPIFEITYNVVFAICLAYKMRANVSDFPVVAAKLAFVNGVIALLGWVGYTIWLVWMQFKWTDMSKECTKGWNVLDFINFIFLMIGSFCQALVIILIVLLILICLPCICCSLKQIIEAVKEKGDLAKKVTGGLLKVKYDEETFKNMQSCAICMCDFDKDAQVTPLPCNIQHYFHAECVSEWMKTKTECPLCREKIDPEKLDQFSKECDEKYGLKQDK